MRSILRTEEFDAFYDSLPASVQNKIKYILYVVEEIRVVSTKLVKKLTGTDFYEMRISTGNEYRVILFAIDNENIVEAERVILLNGFMKKSTKDYKKAIEKAQQIVGKLNYESEYRHK